MNLSQRNKQGKLSHSFCFFLSLSLPLQDHVRDVQGRNSDYATSTIIMLCIPIHETAQEQRWSREGRGLQRETQRHRHTHTKTRTSSPRLSFSFSRSKKKKVAITRPTDRYSGQVESASVYFFSLGFLFIFWLFSHL